MAAAEKRKHARIPVRVPVSCVSLDSNSKPLDQSMVIIRDVSQTGVGIEAHREPGSGLVLLAMVDLNKNLNEITGEVVYSRKTAKDIYAVGVRLRGKSPEIIDFIKKLVRFHHYTKKQDRSTVSFDDMRPRARKLC